MRTSPGVWSARNSRRSALIIAIVVLASAALAMPLGARQPDDAAESAAWVDAPRDGATVLLGAVEVVGHATDPNDVSEIALLLDGTEAQSEEVGGTLAHARFTLDLRAPGGHELVVRSSGSDGAVTSDPVTIIVVEEPNDPAASSTTSTSVPSTTSVPSATTAPPRTVPVATEPTPTAPPPTAPPRSTAPPPTTGCTFAAPTPASPANGSTTPLTRVSLSWAYAGCRDASGYDVEVATNPAFFEAVASTSTAATSWVTSPLFCDIFFWRVRAFDRVDTGPWSAVRSFTISFRGCP